MSSKPQKNSTTTPDKSTTWLSIGAVLAAIGASACCVGPLLLISLGIGGAWMSTLTSMESIRPIFFFLTLLFIWMGFNKLYLNEDSCQDGASCASTKVQKRQRLLFWIGSIAILLLLAFPWYDPYFL